MNSPKAAWSLVVPVKRLAAAKTRLTALAGPHRADLALAFALDTTEAALACDLVHAVVVVTDEPRAARELSRLGAIVVADVPDAGLNPALTHGAARAAQAVPGGGVGALSADLPALRPDELATALAAARRPGASFVRDAAGAGTTLLLADSIATFAPAFGPGSAARHLAAGAAELTDPGLESLRRDVDTPEDLADAMSLGVGPRTTAVVTGLSSAPTRPGG